MVSNANCLFDREIPLTVIYIMNTQADNIEGDTVIVFA